MPEATSKEQTQYHKIIKEFPSDIVCEDRQQFQAEELNQIYHHMLKKYYNPQLDDFKNKSLFFEAKDEYSQDWYKQADIHDQVFIKYRKEKSVGCQHYIRGCELQCPTCLKFFGCRMCHSDSEDHEFPRYKVEVVRCRKCAKVQPISNKCIECNYVFGVNYCKQCHLLCDMGNDAKPFYHCDQCGVCTIGYKEHNQHCEKCQQCFAKTSFNIHKCIRQEENCCICQGNMTNCNYPTLVLECKHQMHYHCYRQLIEKQTLQCPLCKRFMPVDEDREWILQQQKDSYQNTVLLTESTWLAQNLHCIECGKEFWQVYDEYLHYCPTCKMFNCEVLETRRKCNSIQIIESDIRPCKFDLQEVTEVCKRMFKDKFGEVQQILNSQPLKVVAAALNYGPQNIEEFRKYVKMEKKK